MDRVLQHFEKNPIKKYEGVKNEFVQFVGDQFKQLNRRNLGLPMKLYHL